MGTIAGDEVIGVPSETAARIAGISKYQLAAWERVGLVRAQSSKKKKSGYLRIYGLDELVELQVTVELQRRGISIERIHELVDVYRSAQVRNPLTELVWGVDGKHVYVRYADGHWHGGHQPMQGVMTQIINVDEIRATTRKRLRQRESSAEGAVERRKGTMGHKEVFAGTRTPVAALHPYLRRGLPDSDILEAFPHLTRKDIDRARRSLAQAS